MIDLSDEGLTGLALLHLGQSRKGQAGGLQRLQHIMADGGEKARLDPIRAFRDIARLLEFEIGSLQLHERIFEFFRPRLGLRAKLNRRLKQRRGIFRLAHSALDAPHQRAIDLGQLLDPLIGGIGFG